MVDLLIAVFTYHAILDCLVLARITLRIVMESGPCREFFFFFLFSFSFLLISSFHISLSIFFWAHTFPLDPSAFSMLRMRNKRNFKRLTEERT